MAANSLLPDWLPTELPAGERYAGSDTCITCHPKQASALSTAMGDALHRPEQSAFLKADQPLTFKNGPYSYELQGKRYRVTDGAQTLDVPIVWSMGHGKAGQTYVLEHKGALYESRVSFYLAISGLDQTLGAPLGSVPASLEEAMGREMTADDVRGCFGCHATGPVQAGHVNLDAMTPGIQCEGCHGPGTAHIAALDNIAVTETQIASLEGQTAEEQSDFCGSCHRTWAQVMLMDIQGPANVRFQPYRIANSRCYDVDDPRIACAACHDPHADPVHEAEAYDAVCFACHETAAACPVGDQHCSDCHMPEIEIPGSHFGFTDHQIRVVRPGEPYPN